MAARELQRNRERVFEVVLHAFWLGGPKTMQRILVPTDLTDHSLTAVEFAQVFAHHFSSRIYLFYVVDTGPMSPKQSELSESGGVITPHVAHATEELRKLIYWKLNEGGDVIPVVRCGRPPAEIVRYARDQGVDLIVMTTHRRSLRRSVTTEVMRSSPVPVLAVNAGFGRNGVEGGNEDAKEEQTRQVLQ